MTSKLKLLEVLALPHAIFALPIAFTAAFLSMPNWTSSWQLVTVFFAFLAARTAGMAFNRLFDETIDRANPRTSNRSLPAGRISRQSVQWTGIISLTVFVAICLWANWITRIAALPIAGLLLLYPLLKRATILCHFTLGLIEFFAPVLAWAVMTGTVSFAAVLLGLAIFCFISGVDILYAVQDVDFDRSWGLFSIPARWGENAAENTAGILFLLALVFWGWAGMDLSLKSPFWAALGAAAFCLFRLWQEARQGRIALAFFPFTAGTSLAIMFGSLWSALL